MTTNPRELWARGIVLEAMRLELPRAVTLREVQAVQTLSRQESSYGQGWSATRNGPDSVGSMNWGCIQWSPGVAVDLVSGSFMTTDHHRDGTAFRHLYCKYPSDLNGCRHVVRLLERMGALRVAREVGTVRAVSRQLGERHYYEGSGKTAEEAYYGHYKTWVRHLGIIRAGCGDAAAESLDTADTVTASSGGNLLAVAAVAGLGGWIFYETTRGGKRG